MDAEITEEFRLLLETFEKDITAIRKILCVISENSYRVVAFSVSNDKPLLLTDISIVSAVCTLESIILCANVGHFGDAYVLARKFRDDLYQYLFIRKTLEDELGKAPYNVLGTWDEFEMLNEDEFAKIIETGYNDFLYGERSKPHQAATAWLESDIDGEDSRKLREKFLDASKYLRFLRENKEIDDCYKKFFEDICREQDRALNNHVHSNGQIYAYANLNSNDLVRQIEMCEALRKNVILTASIFLSLITLISPPIIGESDYLDALEAGETPVEGTQYMVAQEIADFMNNYFPQISDGLKTYLHENNTHSMLIQ